MDDLHQPHPRPRSTSRGDQPQVGHYAIRQQAAGIGGTYQGAFAEAQGDGSLVWKLSVVSAQGATTTANIGTVGISGTPGFATIGTAYSFTPTASGGQGTKVFAWTGTTLATYGLAINTATGAITGTVSGSAGTIAGSIGVTDDSGTASLPVTFGVYAALGPATASFQIAASVGSDIATFTGLSVGETVVSVSPNDGRVAIGGGGTKAVKGLTASSAGTIGYTFTTSAGRPLGIAITAASVTSTQALWLPYNGLYVSEDATAGTVVATVQGWGSGTTRSITGVKNSAGATVASSLFAISGDDLVTGSTPAVGTDGWYDITIREVGTNTTDTTLTIYVVAKGVASAKFTDAFAGTNGDLLSARSGWTLPSGNSSAGLTINGSNQLATANVGAGLSYTSVVVVDTKSTNHYARFEFPSAPAVNSALLYMRYSDSGNFVRLGVTLADNGTAGPLITPSFRQGGQGVTSVFNGVNAGVGYYSKGSSINAGNLVIEARIIDDRLFIYGCAIGGTPTLLNGFPPAGSMSRPCRPWGRAESVR
jgi:hypothetical protein